MPPLPALRTIPPWLAAALLLGGLYFPSARGGVISMPLYFAHSALILVMLAALLLRRAGMFGGVPLLLAIATHAVLLTCTLFSPLPEYAWGAGISFVLLSVLLCVRLRDLVAGRAVYGLFFAVNLVNLAAAALLTFRTPWLVDFIIENYSMGYPELVPSMLASGKPVLTFGSHSLAGFFFFAFFLLALELYRATRRRAVLLASVLWIPLIVALNSVTSYIFAGVALVQLLATASWADRLAAALVATAGVCVYAWAGHDVNAAADLVEQLSAVMSSSENGLLGRYAAGGALAPNLSFIAQHPFSPIGLGFSDQFFFADSGPVDYLMRGSFPLLIAVYAGLFVFLRRNLWSSRHAWILFLVYLGFEIGYSNLRYPRTVLFLPFMVIFLNGVELLRAQRTAAAAGRVGWVPGRAAWPAR
jgi:hypothetical protein